MANAQLFQSTPGPLLAAANSMNGEGAPAYMLAPAHRLAQYAATGCLNATYYASAEAQLADVLELCDGVESGFIAQTAVYCRERGYMKDMPALLLAVLAARGAPELAAAFSRVVNNGKMLRNFVQIVRSGVAGRKSLGTRPKKLVQQWLNNATEQALLSAAIGASPSLADVLKMVHVKPSAPWREALFAWTLGKPYDVAALPPVLQAYLAYQRDQALPVPAVPFQMLASMPLDAAAWAQLALQGGWQMVRMNLNTFARHGVFELPGLAHAIAAKLRDRQAIAKAQAFPYQLMAAYKAANGVPEVVREALQDAMEAALANVPCIEGKVVVCPDVSGSMQSPVSGYRAGGTTAVRCIDVAALVAAAMLRKNAGARVLPFEQEVTACRLNPRDSVLTNADKLAAIGGGGTNCSAPLAWLNQHDEKADLVLFVSDNESWIDARRNGATQTMREWAIFKRRNPRAKLVCIDIAPYGTTQAQESGDVLNVGGFSDEVFRIIAAFAAGQLQAEHWVGEIRAVNLNDGGGDGLENQPAGVLPRMPTGLHLEKPVRIQPVRPGWPGRTSCPSLSGTEYERRLKMKNYEQLDIAGASPIKMWTAGVPVEAEAKQQLANTAKMPFIYKHIAVMPDVHLGKGSTIGSVIPTLGAIIPAAVGVDIGCSSDILLKPKEIATSEAVALFQSSLSCERNDG